VNGVQVEVGAFIPHVGPLASPSFVPTFCRRAEEVGFDGLWTVEHLAVPQEMASAYTLARRPVVVTSEAVRATMGLNLEMTTTLAVAAAVTSRVRLGTSVAVLPLHNPILNARQVATVDLYSGGRVLYGVGVGWLEEEAAAMGMPWDRRGARSDEHIEILRALWTADGEQVSFDGTFSSFPAIDPAPRPGRRIPVLIGGHSGPAIERAARLGDGWIGSAMGPERLGDALDMLREACARHERELSDLMLVCSPSARLDITMGATAIVDALRPYEELGIAQVQVRVDGRSEESALDALTSWGDHVLPRLR
jgi:probable F420-dependent oxidoreductase